MSTLVDLEFLAAILKHLRHKGHAIELALAIKRAKDLLFAEDFDPIAHFQLG